MSHITCKKMAVVRAIGINFDSPLEYVGAGYKGNS